MTGSKLTVRGLRAGYGGKTTLEDIGLEMPGHRVTAIIGPSGCGKSTFIRCLNRLHETVPGAWVKGEVLLDNRNIYDGDSDPADVRRRVGMVFQRPNPFPTMSVRDNAVAGLLLSGVRDRRRLDGLAEQVLRKAALWDEVKDDLRRSGASLSGGQQQRLCIARALAMEPEVLLMDEPCSALDPAATTKIEDLILQLKKEYTVVIVTHNMQQAARVSDITAFLYLGRLVEVGVTRSLFETPKNELTENYITGRFG